MLLGPVRSSDLWFFASVRPSIGHFAGLFCSSSQERWRLGQSSRPQAPEAREVRLLYCNVAWTSLRSLSEKRWWQLFAPGTLHPQLDSQKALHPTEDTPKRDIFMASMEILYSYFEFKKQKGKFFKKDKARVLIFCNQVPVWEKKHVMKYKNRTSRLIRLLCRTAYETYT